MIKGKDISFIIQGALNKEITPKTIASIRKYFPKAEIVLGTYKGTDIAKLVCNKIELVEDPGSYPIYDHPCSGKNNVNRQIKTTIAGLKVATRKYAFKIRTDFILSGRGFLSYFNKFQKHDINYKIFNHKVLSCVFFARNPRTKNEFPPYPFHPSDVAFFGLREDLLKLFDVPFMTKEESVAYKAHGYNYCRYVPEQHIWVNCLRKNGHIINFDHQRDVNEKIIEDTEKYAVSNFIYLDWKQFNLIPPKHLAISTDNKEPQFDDVITHIEWQRLYKRYLDNSLVVPDKDNLRKLINQNISAWSKPKEHLKRNRGDKMKKIIKKIMKLIRRIFHGDIIRILNDDVAHVLNDKVVRVLNDDVVRVLNENVVKVLSDDVVRILNEKVVHVLNDDVVRVLNENVVRVLNENVVRTLNENVMRVLNDDIIREINHMKTEIQYMKSVFAKREHLFDMASDIKNYISILYKSNLKEGN